jgi:hypothetical protein
MTERSEVINRHSAAALTQRGHRCTSLREVQR